MAPSSLRIACWNVLADCYFTPSEAYRCAWVERFEQISSIIRTTAQSTDLFLLQEVDHLDDCYAPLFKQLGFAVVYVQRPGKGDGCLLAYSTLEFELMRWEEVSFDDLAAPFAPQTAPSLSRIRNQPAGYRHSSLLRHNVSIIAHLRRRSPKAVATGSHTDTKEQAPVHPTVPHLDLVVAVPHIYWNPHFADVKAAQVTYLMDRVASFRQDIAAAPDQASLVPVIVGGDFNSLPDSKVYEILTSPFEWQYVAAHTLKDSGPGPGPGLRPGSGPASGPGSGPCTSAVALSDRYWPSPHRSENSDSRDISKPGQNAVKFLCDATLSKFCRWLRVLGVSCAMYSPPRAADSPDRPPEQQPINYPHLFATSRAQDRILLTSGRKVLERAACPECFVVNAKNSQGMENSLIALFRLYNLPLDVARFLTVCGKCGGDVVACHSSEYRRAAAQRDVNRTRGTDSALDQGAALKDSALQVRVLESVTMCSAVTTTAATVAVEGVTLEDQHRDGEDLLEGEVWTPLDKEIFMCVECLQPYWWSETEHSSPARAMQLAHRLYLLIRSSLMNEDDYNSDSDLEEGQCKGGGESAELSKVELKRMFDRRDAALVTFSKYKHAQLLGRESESSVTESAAAARSVVTEAKVQVQVQAQAQVEVEGVVDAPLSGEREVCGGHLELASVLAQQLGAEGEPPFTNWTDTFKGTLDYVLVSSRGGAAVSVRAAHVMTSEEQCLTLCSSSDGPSDQSGPFPNTAWPSDHLLLHAHLDL